MQGPCETCPFNSLALEPLDEPCNPAQMLPEVRASLDVSQIQTAFECVGNRLVEAERRANRDPLTDLDRYNTFQDKLEAVYRHAPRASEVVIEADGNLRRPLLAIAADGNKFGQVNKRYGHDQGDVALRVITEPFRRIRESNSALTARRGGDELFAAVLGMDYADAADFCDSFTQELATGKAVEMKDGFLVLTVGVVAVYGADIQTYDQATALFELADHFLVDSKQRTRVREAMADTELVEHPPIRHGRLRRWIGATVLRGSRSRSPR